MSRRRPYLLDERRLPRLSDEDLERIEEVIENRAKTPVTVSQVGRVFGVSDRVVSVLVSPRSNGRGTRLRVAVANQKRLLWAVVALLVIGTMGVVFGLGAGAEAALPVLVAGVVALAVFGLIFGAVHSSQKKKLRDTSDAILEALAVYEVGEDEDEAGDEDEAEDEEELALEVEPLKKRLRR